MFPFRKKQIVKHYQSRSDNSTDALYCNSSDVKWILYNKLHVGNFTRVHYDHTSDIMEMCVKTMESTYIRATRLKWLQDKQHHKLALSKAIMDEHKAHFAGATHSSINPNRLSKNYKDAMSQEDRQLEESNEAFDTEYWGLKECNAFKVVRLKPGVTVSESSTPLLGLIARKTPGLS